MLKNFKPNLSKLGETIKSVFESKDRPMPRTVENLKEFYEDSTGKLLNGGRELILSNRQVRFIAFRDYALNASGKPPVVNVKVDPEFNPHVLNVVNGKLVADVMSGNGFSVTNGSLDIEEFLEYFRIGAFVFVDFKN